MKAPSRVLASLLALAACGPGVTPPPKPTTAADSDPAGAPPQAAPQPALPPGAVEVPRSTIVAEAARRILGAAPAGGAWPLFFLGSAGDAARVADDLRRELQRDPRVVFSRHDRVNGPPVADSSVSTGHASVVEDSFTPRPRLTVLVNESGGVLYLAVHDGPSPLDPPPRGWLWTLAAR